MHPLRPIFPMVAFFLAGCATGPRADLAADSPAAKTAVASRLNEILDAAEKKDLPRLDSYHYYGPKFTKFASDQLGRQDAAVACKAEHDGLLALEGLSLHVSDLKVDVLGDAAIATFIMDSAFNAGTNHFVNKARSTLVFVRTPTNGWEIVHEHFSALKPK